MIIQVRQPLDMLMRELYVACINLLVMPNAICFCTRGKVVLPCVQRYFPGKQVYRTVPRVPMWTIDCNNVQHMLHVQTSSDRQTNLPVQKTCMHMQSSKVTHTKLPFQQNYACICEHNETDPTNAKLRIEFDTKELADDQFTASECASRQGNGASCDL